MKRLIVMITFIGAIINLTAHANTDEKFHSELKNELSVETGLNETLESYQSNDDLFNKLSDIKGVEVVYISKAMLGMAADMNIPGMEMGGVDIENILHKMDGLLILSADAGNAVKTLKSEANKLVKKGKYETLMFVKDEDSKTVFYTNKIDSSRSEMLMVMDETDEITMIRFTGTFTMKDLQNLTKDRSN